MQYDFSLASKQAQVMEVKGEYFLYKSGLGPIRITPSSGSPVDLMPGQGMSGLKFDKFTVQDLSGANNAGFLLAGVGNWIDARTTGTVEVVDGGKSRTMAGSAFTVWNAAGAVAGQQSMVQLLNPVGNLKNVILESLSVASGSTTGFEVRTGMVEGAGPTQNGISKNLTTSIVYSTGYTRAGAVAASSGGLMFLLNAAINTTQSWRPVEPIVLTPGAILTIVGQGAQKDVSASFEWYESLIANG